MSSRVLELPAALPNRIGKTLRELELHRDYGVSVVGMHDVLRDLMMAVTDPDTVLNESDTLLVAGEDEDFARAAECR